MIIGAEFSSKQAKLINQYIQALERQIAAQKKEVHQFQKFFNQLTQDNNRLTDQFYTFKKEKQCDREHIKWLERELQLLQRDINFLLEEKARLQMLLAQSKSQAEVGIVAIGRGSSRAQCNEERSSCCKTALLVELGQLKKVADERQEEARCLRLQRDSFLEECESLKRQRSALLQSYKCDSIIQLAQRLSFFESREEQLQLLKNNSAARQAELAQMDEKLTAKMLETEQIRQVSIALREGNQSLQTELELHSQRLQFLAVQLAHASQIITQKERQISELQHQNSALLKTIELSDSLHKGVMGSQLQILGFTAEQLRSRYEKAVEECRMSLQQCSALERSIEQMEARSSLLLAEKEEQIKKLAGANEQLRRELGQTIEQVEERLITITRLEQQNDNYSEALAAAEVERNRQYQARLRAVRGLQEQLQKKASEIDRINRKNEGLSNSLSKLQEESTSDKLEMEILRRKALFSEGLPQSPQIETLSEVVGILREAMNEQTRIIESLGVAVGQREEDILVLESSNSELRRQIISAINNQEMAMKELTGERERRELRTRRRQKPYFFSRVTSYENELDSLCRQSVKPSSTGNHTIAPPSSQSLKHCWSRSEGNRQARRSLVEQIIRLNEESDAEEAEREMVQIFS